MEGPVPQASRGLGVAPVWVNGPRNRPGPRIKKGDDRFGGFVSTIAVVTYQFYKTGWGWKCTTQIFDSSELIS